MKIEKIPDFISSPLGLFAFDKNGRFIYVKEDTMDCPTFTIYDIFYNSYIELIPDSSILDISLGQFPDIRITNFLPINIEKFLLFISKNNVDGSLLLVSLNVKEKSYGILDEVFIPKCGFSRELLCNDDIFGIYYTKQEESDTLAFLSFTISENRIMLNAEKRIMYIPYSELCHPKHLCWRNNRLWFIRRNDVEWIMHNRYPRGSPTPPSNQNLRISYFDLLQEFPTEIHVGDIILNHLAEPFITHLKWVEDSLLLQLTTSKFDLFDLVQEKWMPEAVDCGIKFRRGEDASFAWFPRCHNGSSDYWEEETAVHIDNQFVLIVVNQRSKSLYRIPLRNPLKLHDMAWTVALNAGLLNVENSTISLPKKILYLRAF